MKPKIFQDINGTQLLEGGKIQLPDGTSGIVAVFTQNDDPTKHWRDDPAQDGQSIQCRVGRAYIKSPAGGG